MSRRLSRFRLDCLVAHFRVVGSLVGGPGGGEVGSLVGEPVGGEDGTMTGGPVGGEVGCPDGSEIPAPAGLRRLQGEMNAPLIESQWGLMVGVLYIRQTEGRKDEHGTHV